MIHIIVGDEAAQNLVAAFELDENLKGEVLVWKDTLNIGPIATDDKPMDGVRTTFWRQYLGDEFEGVMDTYRLHQWIEKAKEEEEPMCLWMAPCVSDVCVYYYLLTQFKDYPGMFHLINIDSLPFLNEKGQVFYPKDFSEVPPKEFVKTKRLLREISPADYETDGDDWGRLQEENTMVRVYKGGKDIASENEAYFDKFLFSCVEKEAKRGSKIIRHALQKINQGVSDIFLYGRLKAMANNGQIICNETEIMDVGKAEFKLAGGDEAYREGDDERLGAL